MPFFLSATHLLSSLVVSTQDSGVMANHAVRGREVALTLFNQGRRRINMDDMQCPNTIRQRAHLNNGMIIQLPLMFWR
jgi:hypothetical protein